ncbi:DUF5719 family protein, partial [Actinocorallia lasiicapitis]
AEAVVACPEVGGGRIGVVSAGEAKGEGVVRDGKEAAVGKAAAGSAWSGSVPKRGGLVVRAEGGAAAGLAVDTTLKTKQGVGGARCGAPGTEHWFVTPGAGSGKIDLHLANVDDRDASVDVIAISDAGRIDTPDGHTFTVDAHENRVIHLDKNGDGLGLPAVDSRMLAIKVVATSGRVAAAVKVDLGAKGYDWAPASAAPARTVILPGLPGGSGARTLFVAVPGEADARVKIQAVTAGGVFVPEGQDVLDAPAETVTPVDLESALVGKPAALVLTADRPIVAGFQAGGDDVSLGAGAAPLTGPTTLADAREGSTLLLTAPEGPARVRVTPVTSAGRGKPQEHELGAQRTLEIPQDSDALIVEPLQGTVYGARVVSLKSGKDRFVTVQPLTPTPVTLRLPPVADSLTAITR